jgi:membrane protease YdiL (CAAX protease family)
MSEQIKRYVPWLIILALLYMCAENFILTHLLTYLPFLYIPGTNWNWSGKAAGIVFSAVVLACSPWLRQNVGLHWRQSPGSLRWSLIIFVSFLGCGIVSGFIDPLPSSRNTPDTLFFQATMPSLEEELASRGIMLALLEKAFGQSPMSCRWRFGWAALITSLLFWQGHGLYRVDTFFIGAALALVRTRSGSLLWPMLCHSAVNVGSVAIVMMRP